MLSDNPLIKTAILLGDKQEEKKEENKADKFRRLANIRVSNILDELDLLGNLASPNYEYSAEQIEQIFLVIKNQFTLIHNKFYNPKGKRFNVIEK